MAKLGMVFFLCALLAGCGIVSGILGSPDDAEAAGGTLTGVGGAVAATGNPVAWVVGGILSALGYGLTAYGAWKRKTDGNRKK